MKYLYYLLLLISLTTSSFSLTLTINEERITEYLDDDTVEVKVTGNYTIESQESLLYFNIKENNNILSNYSITNQQYTIDAIIGDNVYKEFKREGVTFFEYINTIDIETRRDISLSKFEREFENQATSQRKIVIQINPNTNFNQSLNLKLIKTRPDTINQFRDESNTLKIYNITMPENQLNLTYYDENSMDGDSYWIEYDLITHPIIIRNAREFALVETTPIKQGEETESIVEEEIIEIEDLIIRKEILPSIYSPNENITIKITLQNPNNFRINDIIVIEELSETIVSRDDKTKTQLVEIINLEAFETKIIEFQVFSLDSENEVTFIPETRIEYVDKVSTSETIPIYKEAQENERRIAIEKEITRISYNTAKISLTLTNIGNSSLEEFRIFDANSNKYYYIPNLDINGEYNIEYGIQDIDYSVPTIISEEEISTVSTIILNEEITTSYTEETTFPIYSLALIVLAGVLLITDIIV